MGRVPTDGAGVAVVRAVGTGATAVGAPRGGGGGRRVLAGGAAVVRHFARTHSAAIFAGLHVRVRGLPARRDTHTDHLLQSAGPSAAGACSLRAARGLVRQTGGGCSGAFLSQGVWQGLLTGAGCLARALGPLFVAAVYARRGPDATFGSTAALTLAALLALRLVYGRLRPPDLPAGPAARELRPLGPDT